MTVKELIEELSQYPDTCIVDITEPENRLEKCNPEEIPNIKIDRKEFGIVWITIE